MIKVNETTELVFETFSGTQYWIADGKIKREPYPSQALRGDSTWLPFVTFPELWFDTPAILVLESLAGDGEGVTIRTTSPIIRIEERS